MKKLIFTLFTTTFIVMSFLSIKQFEFKEFQNFNNESTGEKWSFVIESGNPQKSKKENFQLLEEMALQIEVNFQRVSYERDENNRDKIVYYVAFFENDKYFEKMKLKSGKFLSIDSSENEFLSTIETNNDNQIGQIEIFRSFNPIEIRPMISAEKIKDIKGTYTVNGKGNAEKLKKIALEYGFVAEILKDQSQSSLTPYPYKDMIYIASLILCLLIALAMLYDLINNYKQIAVRYLLGYSFWQIGVYLFKNYFKNFLCSLAIVLLGLIIYLYSYNEFQQLGSFLYFWLKTIIPLIIVILLNFVLIWLVTKTINISQMIKDKKPIKLLVYINIIIRFILVIILVLGLEQGISTFYTLKNTVDKQEKWDQLKDYSYLGIISDSSLQFLKFEDEKEKQQFQLLYKELESQGAFYISPSSEYINNHQISLEQPNLGRVEINKNYLDINPIIGLDNKPVKILDDFNYNEITIIVPIKLKQYENDIKASISKDYTGIYGKEYTEPTTINIIYVKDDQSYFTFSTNMAEKNNYEIIDPIAIVVNSSFDPRILAVNISMGYGYYIPNSGYKNPFELTKNTLIKYELDHIWQPISIAYSNVELKIANDKELLQLVTIYCSIFIILAIVLLFFSCVYYLEINKKTLALQWIFGYEFMEKHYLAYLVMLVFWNFIFASCYLIGRKTILIAKIVLTLTLFDIVLISIMLIVMEYNITKQILIEK